MGCTRGLRKIPAYLFCHPAGNATMPVVATDGLARIPMANAPESGHRGVRTRTMARTITPADHREQLRRAGLRPTRQRLALAALLFAQGDRHVTAERLHEEVLEAGVSVSLATVYN